MKNYKFIVSGRVQGVYYRKNIHDNSLKARFSGYVKNLPNKNVEACITCDEQDLGIFIDILKQGSMLSRVDNIEQFQINESFKGDFKIIY